MFSGEGRLGVSSTAAEEEEEEEEEEEDVSSFSVSPDVVDNVDVWDVSLSDPVVVSGTCSGSTT